jgi:hypothetical protein
MSEFALDTSAKRKYGQNNEGSSDAPTRTKRHRGNEDNYEQAETGNSNNSQPGSVSNTKQKRKDRMKKKKKQMKKLKKLNEANKAKSSHSDSEQKADATSSGKSRDFATDLSVYVDQWKESVGTNQPDLWKFNKVLQEWALQHCLTKTLVPADLFKKLLPYVATVKGSALTRLVERLKEIADQEVEDVEESSDDPEQVEKLIKSIEVKRAKRILTAISKVSQSK